MAGYLYDDSAKCILALGTTHGFDASLKFTDCFIGV